jgi:hypothetical protein
MVEVPTYKRPQRGTWLVAAIGVRAPASQACAKRAVTSGATTLTLRAQTCTTDAVRALREISQRHPGGTKMHILFHGRTETAHFAIDIASVRIRQFTARDRTAYDAPDARM